MIKSNWLFWTILWSVQNFLLALWTTLFIWGLLITLWIRITSPAYYEELAAWNWTFVDQWVYYIQKTFNSMTSWLHNEQKSFVLEGYWLWYIVVDGGKKYYIADVLIKDEVAYNSYMNTLVWKNIYIDWHFKSNDWEKILTYIYLIDDKDMINGRLITMGIGELSYHQWISMYYWVYLIDYLKLHNIINN